MDRGGLIVEMKHQPQLNARVGHYDTDLSRFGWGQRPIDVGMLVDVEDAPVLVVRVTLAASCHSKINSASRDSLFNKLHRRAVGTWRSAPRMIR